MTKKHARIYVETIAELMEALIESHAETYHRCRVDSDIHGKIADVKEKLACLVRGIQ